MIRKVLILLSIFVSCFIFAPKVSADMEIEGIDFPDFDTSKPYLVVYSPSEQFYYLLTDFRMGDSMQYDYAYAIYNASSHGGFFYTTPDGDIKSSNHVSTRIWAYTVYKMSSTVRGQTSYISSFSALPKDFEVVTSNFPIYDENKELLYAPKLYHTLKYYDDIPSLPFSLSEYDDYVITYSGSEIYETLEYHIFALKNFDGIVQGEFGNENGQSIAFYNKNLTQTIEVDLYQFYLNGDEWKVRNYFSSSISSLTGGILYSSLPIYSFPRGSTGGIMYFPSNTLIFKPNFSEFYANDLISYTKDPIFYETIDEKYVEGYNVNIRFKYSDYSKYKYEYSIDNGSNYVEFNPVLMGVDDNGNGVTSPNHLHLSVYKNTTIKIKATNKETGEVLFEKLIPIDDIYDLNSIKYRIDISRQVNETEIDGIDEIVKSELLTVNVKTLDKNHIYRYSKDNGTTWKEVKIEEFLPLGLKIIITENNTFIFEVLDKKTKEVVNSETIVIDSIGMTIEQYQDEILQIPEEEESDNVIVKFFKQLINEKFPIFSQISSVIKTLGYDDKIDEPPSLEIDLSQYGAGKVPAIDFSFYEKYRETVFTFIYLTLGTYTAFKGFKRIKLKGE